MLVSEQGLQYPSRCGKLKVSRPDSIHIPHLWRELRSIAGELLDLLGLKGMKRMCF